jgi:hypothetical protein
LCLISTVCARLIEAGPAGAAGAKATASEPTQYAYSPKVLTQIERARETGDLYHGFPIALDKLIIDEGYRVAISSKYIEYVLQGWVNQAEGVYQIGVNPQANGIELIVHRFFQSFGQ